MARQARRKVVWEGLTGPANPFHSWASATVLETVKNARPWRTPLRGGLRPSLTTPARRAAPESVGIGNRLGLRLRPRRIEQEAADKKQASRLCRVLARLGRHWLQFALLTVGHALGQAFSN